jgi:hemolysin III
VTLSELLPKLHYPTRLEKLADGWVHAIGLVVFSLAASTLLGLSIWQGGFGQAAAVLIYAICLITMIACSFAYNMTENAKRKALLRRFDHAGIFLMIAGSYTPFTTQRFEGGWAIGMTAAVWSIAALGIVGKLFAPNLPKWLWLTLYIGLGWMVVAAFGPLVRTVSLAAVILLAVGGAIYTLGVPFYAWEKLPFRRAIWHGFVMVAAGVQYAAVLTGVVFA